jgi:hypothetical protein
LPAWSFSPIRRGGHASVYAFTTHNLSWREAKWQKARKQRSGKPDRRTACQSFVSGLWTPAKLKGSVSLKEALQTSPTTAAARVWHAEPEELPFVKQTLATQASIRTDQHLIKYTRACLDMMSFDPQSEKLYLAAAAHLCGLWLKESPEAKIRENLFKDRKGK